MKRNGERGSPCLIPLQGLKGYDGIPFMRIEKKFVEIRFRIHHTHIG